MSYQLSRLGFEEVSRAEDVKHRIPFKSDKSVRKGI